MSLTIFSPRFLEAISYFVFQIAFVRPIRSRLQLCERLFVTKLLDTINKYLVLWEFTGESGNRFLVLPSMYRAN